MGKRLPLTSKDTLQFAKLFEPFRLRRNAWDVWCDFINIMAKSVIAWTPPLESESQNAIRDIENLMGNYDAHEQAILLDLAKLTIAALEQRPFQDFLGELHMGLNFNNTWKGQYFTPWSMSYLLGSLNAASIMEKSKPYYTVCDFCCGAGSTLIATAAAYAGESQDSNFRNDLLFIGQDIDPLAAKMCFIQLSLIGCAGFVVIGDCLTEPLGGSFLAPKLEHTSEIMFTPAWFSPLWESRRQDAL